MTSQEPKPRSGVRTGAGRPRLAPDLLILVSVRLTPQLIDKFTAYGQGNVSAGIRRAGDLIPKSEP